LDIGSLGIGRLLATVVNIALFKKNRKYDLNKERLINLYNPLNALIQKKYKYLQLLKIDANNYDRYVKEYYRFFLGLQDIYYNNEVYASPLLREAFHTLNHNHEIEYYNYACKYNYKDEILNQVALFEHQHQKNSDDLSEFEQRVQKIVDIVKNDLYEMYH